MKIWQSLAVGVAGGLAFTYWLIEAGDSFGFREVVARNPEALIYFLAISTFALVVATLWLLQRARARAAADKVIARQDDRADPTLIDAVIEVAAKNGRKSQVLEELQAARIARGSTGILIKDVYWLMGRAAGVPLDGDSGRPPWTNSNSVVSHGTSP